MQDQNPTQTSVGLWNPIPRALRRWTAASPSGNCAYLEIAGIKTPEVRYEQDGTGLVPITPVGSTPDAALIGLQSVKSDGTKTFTPGMRLKGSACAVGLPTLADDIIFVTEGYRTAAAIRTAFDGALKGYAAFSFTNLGDVTRAAREYHPDAYILVCSDNDSMGLRAADAAATAVMGACLVSPSFGFTHPPEIKLQNFGDLFIHESQNAVRQQIETAIEHARQKISERRADSTNP